MYLLLVFYTFIIQFFNTCVNIEFSIDDRPGTSEIRYRACAETASSCSQACGNRSANRLPSASEGVDFSFAY